MSGWPPLFPRLPLATAPKIDLVPSAILQDAFAGRILRTFGAKRLESVLFKAQPTLFIDLEFSQLEAARPEINRQK